MSFDLASDEQRNWRDTLKTTDTVEAGAFKNFWYGTGMGAMKELAKAGRAVDLLGSLGPIAQDKFYNAIPEQYRPPDTGGTIAQDRYFKEHDERYQSAVDYWTPRPNEVGIAGEVAGTLLGTLPLVLASPGFAVGALQLGTAEDLVKKGVDARTANLVGAVQAGGLGLGIWAPILGRTLWQRMVIGGAGFNVIQGVGTRAGSQWLLGGGPAEKDYVPLDPASLMIDTLLGFAFGGFSHLSPEMRAQGDQAVRRLQYWASRLKPSDIDALAVMRQGEHLNTDTLPGRPVTMADQNAHTDRMRTAAEQLATDKPVDVQDIKVNVPRETSEGSPEGSREGSRDPEFTVDSEREKAANLQLQQLRAEADQMAIDEGQVVAPDAGDAGTVYRAYRDLHADLLETGRLTPEQVNEGAKLAEAFYNATAKRLGKPVADLLKEYPLRVIGEAPARPDSALEQARNTTATPEFKTWFGESKVVDEQGAPLVVYHGTGSDFSVFEDRQFAHTEMGEPATIFFTSSKTASSGYAQDRGSATWQIVDAADGHHIEEPFHTREEAQKYADADVGVRFRIEQIDRAPNVMPVYLSMKKPLEVDAEGTNWSEIGKSPKVQAIGYGDFWTPGLLAEWAFKNGYDGLIVRNVDDNVKETLGELHDVYIVTEPTQVKSATGNRGTFDPESPNILYQAEREIRKAEADRIKGMGFDVRGGVVSGAPDFIRSKIGVVNQIKRAVKDALSDQSHPEDMVWYREAGRAIREYTHGDLELMEKITRIVAKLSQASGVNTNVTQVIKAAYQIATGEPIAVGRFPNVFREQFGEAIKAAEFTSDLKGVDTKLQSFYRNLHDEAFQENRWPDDVVIDRHAINYIWQQPGKDSVASDAQYRYAQRVMQLATEAYNKQTGASIKPRDMQAMLWGIWKRSATGAAGTTETGAGGGAWNYPQFFERATANITAEVIPSKTLPVGAALEALSYEQKQAFQQAVLDTIIMKDGKNELARMAGLVLYREGEGSGGYAGTRNPNVITGAIARKKAMVSSENDPYHRYEYEAVDRYARAWQYIFQQDGVPWFRADVTLDPATLDAARERRAAREAKGQKVGPEPPNLSLGYFLNFDGALTQAQEAQFHDALQVEFGFDPGYTVVKPDRIALVNYRDAQGKPFGLSDVDFDAAVKRVFEKVGGKELINYGAESKYHHHDFAADPEGLEIIRSEADAGRPGWDGFLRDRREAFNALSAEWAGRAGQEGVTPQRLYQGGDEPPIFYSELSRQIEAKAPKQADAAQWLATIKNLKGVKADEIKWSGIEEWLAMQAELGGKSFEADLIAEGSMLSPGERRRIAANPGMISRMITKKQVTDFLAHNGVKVEEVMLGDEPDDGGYTIRFNDAETEHAGIEMVDVIDPRNGFTRFTGTPYDARQWIEGQADAAPSKTATKFENYQLPGGNNYRELLLTLPTADTRNSGLPDGYSIKRMSDGRYTLVGPDGSGRILRGADGLSVEEATAQARSQLRQNGVLETNQNFHSSHFDTPNILAHVRFNERTDADGKQVLFVEEFQSDWAQKGKKEGFNNVPLEVFETPDGQFGLRHPEGRGHTPGLRFNTREEAEAAASTGGYGIPAAPFVGKTDAWVSLAVKRMIRYAAEHGYDRIAWTTGAQQVDRYSSALKKAVDQIQWTKTDKGVQIVGYKGGAPRGWGNTDLDVEANTHLQVSPEIREQAYQAIRRNDNLGFDQPGEALGAVWADRLDWAQRWGDVPHEDALSIQNYVDARMALINASRGARTRYIVTGREGQEYMAHDSRAAAQRHIDSYDATTRGFLSIQERTTQPPPRNKVVDTTMAENDLSDAIGKAMADRIRNDPAQSGVIEGDDITVSDTGMAGFYDRIVPNIVNDVSKKLGGGKVSTGYVDVDAAHRLAATKRDDGTWTIIDLDANVGSRNEYQGVFKTREETVAALEAMREEKNQQPGLDITPAMREKAMSGLPLFQNEGGQPRGYMERGVTTHLIGLLKDADASTYVHELGHFFLDVTNDIALKADTPTAMKQDMARLYEWFGVKDADAWNKMSLNEQRPYHEKFARGFERYLAEGKAPTPELEGVFSRFKQWIIEVYKSLRKLNVQVSDEVRGVMGRMLGAPEIDIEVPQLDGMLRVGKSENDKPSELLADIAALGGISKEYQLGLSGESKRLPNIRGDLFNENGLSIDDLVTQLRERDWLIEADEVDDGVAVLSQMIDDEIRGARARRATDTGPKARELDAEAISSKYEEMERRAAEAHDFDMRDPELVAEVKRIKTMRDLELAQVLSQDGDHVGAEARRFVARNADQTIQLGVDADGKPITRTVREFLDAVDQGVAQAKADEPLFYAAAECMLGAGD